MPFIPPSLFFCCRCWEVGGGRTGELPRSFVGLGGGSGRFAEVGEIDNTDEAVFGDRGMGFRRALPPPEELETGIISMIDSLIREASEVPG